jgi:hypothetical protein
VALRPALPRSRLPGKPGPRGAQLTAIEVKSGRVRDSLPGMAAFDAAYGPTHMLLVGEDGTPLEAFLGQSLDV